MTDPLILDDIIDECQRRNPLADREDAVMVEWFKCVGSHA